MAFVNIKLDCKWDLLDDDDEGALILESLRDQVRL